MEINYGDITIDELSPEPIVIGSSDTEGDLIILIPGANVEISELEDVFSLLATKYNVVAFKYPNEEILIDNRKVSLNDYFVVMDSLIDKYQKLPVAVIGQSLGGGIALAYSAFRPDIRKVVAVSPLVSQLKEGTLALYLSALKNIWQVNTVGKKYTFANSFKNYILKPRRFLNSHYLLNSFHIDKYIDKVNSSALFFIGDRDYLISPNEQKKVAKRLKDVKIIEYKELGHSLIHTNTQDVVENIFRFIES